MTMPNVVLTGASGFVGTAMIQRLKVEGLQVSAVYRSQPATQEEGMVSHVLDIGPEADWSNVLQECDIVIHLAARVHVMKDTVADPLAEFRRANLDSTINLARQAASAGVKRFVYLSSIKVNGEATAAAPFRTLDRPAPQDPYGISKWESEQALHAISVDSGMEVVIIRPPLVYGPGVRANFLALLGIVNRALPLPLGQVHNHRSMVYLGNLVDAIYHSAIDPRAAGKTFLVADGQDVSTPELIRMLAAAMGRPYRVFDFPVKLLRGLAALIGKSSSIDRLTQSLVVDSSEIRQQLHWSPPYTLDQGLQETVDWYLHKVQSR
jgi:nucleoside-diphosphate-sugar epimerase